MSDIPDLALRHEALTPRIATAKPPLLVLLHGYGSNEEDLLQIAPYLPDQFQVVSLRAPFMLMPGSNAWFAIEHTNDGLICDVTQAQLSLVVLNESIDQAICIYGTDPHQTFVAGFSQGGAMAGLVAMSRNDVRGTVIMSGINPFKVTPNLPTTPCNSDILIVHGTIDEVVSLMDGQASRDSLLELGFAVKYIEFPIGHTIDLRVIGALTRFLTQRLK
ncbi:MAG: alpha/beta fold hydrolase [Chloroflexales bacterium]|nr:alpha/beta fold hydrolase [Chloroflexales bacterium]